MFHCAMASSAPFSHSKTSNEIARKGGLPPKVRARARALMRENPGWTLSRAIATAISQYQKEGSPVAGQWSRLKHRMRTS